MFPLSRPFRQGLATAALVVLTVLPTAFVAVHAWRINRPGHVRDVEIALGRRLGMQVTLDRATYPRPGEVVYQGIVLRREEPRSKGLVELARAGTIRIISAGRDLTIHAEDMTLVGETPKEAMATVDALLQRSGELPYDRVNLTIPSCRIELGDGLAFSIQDIAGAFQADPVEPKLSVAYRMVEDDSKTRCELVLSRKRSVDPVQTTLAFKTLEGPPLSARALNVFFDATGWMGDDAKVAGSLDLRRSGTREWEGEFQGDLLDIDLAALVDRRFPSHRLAGSARVAVESARWGDRPGQGPGWIEAKGRLSAARGVVGADLLGALAREMRFRLDQRAGRIDPRKTELEFGALGMTFDMRADGEIHLTGSLGSEYPPEAVLAGGANAMAYAPRGAANVHGLIKTLVPVAEAQAGTLVPLTAESRVLLHLPAPPDAIRPSRTMDAN